MRAARLEHYTLQYLRKATMWLGLVFIGYFVVSAALDDLDIEVSTVNRFHGDDGGGDEVGGMTPRSSKRMHSAAPGISLMAMGSPEMEMADNMAMSFDVPPSMAHQRSARSSRMHEGSTGSSTSFSSPNSQSLGVSFIEGAPSASFDPASVQTMLVRTGSVDISTDKDLDDLKAAVVAAVLAVPSAFVASSNANGGWLDDLGRRHGQSVHLVIRVPVDRFFPLRDAVQALVPSSDVGSVSDSANDVTAQYVDAAARAATLRATHAQLVLLMKKADSVESVLKVQRELTRVTQELEAKEATLKRLSSSASLSTLNVDINQKPDRPLPPPQPPSWSLRRTVERAWQWLRHTLTKVVDVVVFVIVAAVPLSLAALFIGLVLHVAGRPLWNATMLRLSSQSGSKDSGRPSSLNMPGRDEK